jgi:histidine triad (HIT) family protein
MSVRAAAYEAGMSAWLRMAGSGWLAAAAGGMRRSRMADGEVVPDCFVCRKHRDRDTFMPAGPAAEDELVIVSHTVPPDVLGQDGTTAYLGHLFVEPKRHASGLADLTGAEAGRVGLWCTCASRALRDVAGAEHVYAAVIGDEVPHLHVHLLARFPGPPREFWWTRVDRWPEARRGSAAEIDVFVAELRRCLADGEATAGGQR